MSKSETRKDEVQQAMNFLTPLPWEEQLHCRRVAAVSKIIADAAGLSMLEAKSVEQAAMFHDVGKAVLPRELLRRDVPLSCQQQAALQSHTKLGMQMMKGTEGILNTASIVAFQHHERLDGSGYFGLTAQMIHPHAKLVAVADMFDATAFCGCAGRDQGLVQACMMLIEKGGRELSEEYILCLLNHLDQILAACDAINAHIPANAH